MKKIFLHFRLNRHFRAACLLFLVGWFSLNDAMAQVSLYSFAASSGTFTPVSGGTAVATSVSAADFLGDTKTSVAIPLGFTFTFNNVNYTQVVAASDGFISFNLSGTSTLTNNLNSTSTSRRPLLAPLWDDLDGAGGSAKYITTGTAGSQVFTIEFLNWKWNYNATGAVVSFQIKLYEGTNKIEYIYRQETAAVNSGSASIGISGATTGSGNYLSLNNSGVSPTASSTSETTNISAKPATGQVYTFSPPVSCTGAPTAGTTTAPALACSGTSFSLSLSGNTTGTGIQYQWQSSPDGSAWANISGATSASYSATQTAATYYRCNVTCTNSSQTATSNAVQVGMNTPLNCYCAASVSNGGDTDIGNVTFGALNNGTALPTLNNATATNTYTNYTALTPVDFPQGSTNAISVTQITGGGTFYSAYLNVFIDYNQNGVFDLPAERALSMGSTSATTSTYTLTGNITIPFTALTGNTRMRVELVEGATSSTAACGSVGSYGEVEDYMINITFTPSCSGAPTAGTASSSTTSVCSGTNFTLSLAGNSATAGIQYQWQSSPDGSAWANISGATEVSYTGTQTAATYYRCNVTCSISSQSATSNAVQVGLTNFLACYCAASVSNAGDTDIGNVTFGTLNNGNASPTTSNATATGTYTDYTSVPAPSFMQGSTGTITVTQITSGTTFYSAFLNVFIDYNHNGVFDLPAERVLATGSTSSTTSTYSLTGDITIPLNALTGNTRMRVELVEGGSNTTAVCGSVGSYGEVEDYIINILLAPVCNGAPTSGTASISAASVCYGMPVTLSLAGYTNEVGISLQWQSASSAGGTYTNIVGATTNTYQVSPTANTFYRCVVTCANPTPTSSNSNVVDVTVSGAAATAPYFEGLEGITANDELPSCWSVSNTSICQTYTAADDNNRIPRTGDKFGAFKYGTNAAGDYFYTQAIQLTGGVSYKASVWYVTDGANGWTEFSILYGTTPTSTGLTSIATAPLVSGNLTNIQYLELAGNFTPPTTGVYFIALRAKGNFTPWYLSFDDLRISPPCTGAPTAGTIAAPNGNVCRPTDLVLAGTTSASGITYQWQSSTTSASTGFSAVSGATASAYTAPVPAGNIWYRCLVTCTNSSQTQFSNVVQLSPFTGVSGYPYNENFDGLAGISGTYTPTPVASPTNGNLPCGWVVENANGDNRSWSNMVSGVDANSSPNALVYTYNFASAADDWAFSPAMNFTAGKKYALSFKYRSSSDFYVEALEVRWGNAATSAAMLPANVLFNNTNISVLDYQTATADIVPTVSGSHRVGFLVKSNADQDALLVDDVQVIESCQTAAISPATLPVMTNGTAYSQTFTQTGMTTTLTWSATGLPAGITLNPTTGVMSGTATVNGNYTIAVTITNSAGCFSTKNYNVQVGDAPTITTHPVPVSICPSKPAVFSVVANSTADATYQWQQSVGSGAFANINNDATFSGTSTNTLTVNTVIGMNGNAYRCVVTNPFGVANSNAALLTVSDAILPVVTNCPANITRSNIIGRDGAIVDYAPPTATDNCGLQSFTRTAGLAQGSFFPVGTTTITYTATDFAGNTATCSFTVTVDFTNSAPTFTASVPPAVLEDSGAKTIANWATGNDNDEANQTLSYEIAEITNPHLFSVVPNVLPDGTLTYTPAPNAFGMAGIKLRIKDSGGTANGGIDVSAYQTFPIEILPVDDEPTLNAIADVKMFSGSSMTINLSGITSGEPVYEANQKMSVMLSVVSGANSVELPTSPVVVTNGTASFVIKFREAGEAVVKVSVMDDGGIANGGDDTIERTFKVNSDSQDEAFLPSMFTPNDDQENDFFRVKTSIDLVDHIKLEIFTTEGTLLYTSDLKAKVINEGWNGKNLNGVEQPQGVYAWKISGKYKNGKDITITNGTDKGLKTGRVDLIRGTN